VIGVKRGFGNGILKFIIKIGIGIIITPEIYEFSAYLITKTYIDELEAERYERSMIHPLGITLISQKPLAIFS